MGDTSCWIALTNQSDQEEQWLTLQEYGMICQSTKGLDAVHNVWLRLQRRYHQRRKATKLEGQWSLAAPVLDAGVRQPFDRNEVHLKLTVPLAQRMRG